MSSINLKFSSLSNTATHKFLLLFIVAVCYINILGNGYNLDDNLVTQNHPLTSKGLASVKDIFSSKYYSNNADINFGYRPIALLSFAIEHQFLGESPLVSHFINLLLFALSTLLFYKLISRWTNNKTALYACLLFAVHPIHTEVVDSIKNRDELLAFLFMVSALLFTNKFIHKRTIWLWLLALGCCALSILSKKSAYPMIFVGGAALIFFNNQNIFKTLVAYLSLVIPSTVLGSDVDVKRGVMMFLASILFFFLCYGVKRFHVIKPILVRIVHSLAFQVLCVMCSGLILFWAQQNNQLVYALLAMPFIIWISYVRQWNYWLLIILLTTIAILFDNSIIQTTTILATLGYLYYKFIQKEIVWHDYLLASIITITLLLSTRLQWGTLNIVLLYGLYLFLLNKKAWLAVLYSMLLLVLGFAFFQVHFYMVVFFAFGISLLLQNVKWFSLHSIVSIITIAVIAHASIKSKSVEQVYSMNVKTIFVQSHSASSPTHSNNVTNFTEGRSLNYIENTLTQPHSDAEKLATGFLVLGEYLYVMIFPKTLSFYYGYSTVQTASFDHVFVWVSLITHLLLIAIALWQIKKRPILSIGILWYIACVLLFSNWVELVAGMMGERLAFSASAGFCLTVAAIVAWLKPNVSMSKPKTFEFIIIGVLCLLATRTIARNADWKDALTLMSNDIEHLDESAQAHNLLALNLMHQASTNVKLNNQQRLSMQQQAIVHLKKSIEIYPYFINTIYDLARIYIGLNDFEQAKIYLEKALAIDPDNLFALESMSKICFELNLPQETEAYANKYLDIIPQNENVHEILVYSMLTHGYKQQAIKYAENALKYYPNNTNLQRMLIDANALK
jgi:hypothetical protein